MIVGLIEPVDSGEFWKLSFHPDFQREAYVTEPAAEESKGLAKKVEELSKLGTLVLVGLYVLGLLITNGHLMLLGIADFSALQARFVMTGILFVIYTLILLMLPVSLVFGLWVGYQIVKNMSTGWARLLLSLLAILLCLWLVVELFGSIVGYMLPWGRAWDMALKNEFKPSFYIRDLVTCAHQLKDAFWHAKIIFAGVALQIMLAMFLYLMGLWGNLKVSEDAHKGLVKLAPYLSLLAAPSLFLLIMGYADSVFPNLLYNVGGGQPHIIELHLKATEAPSLLKELPALNRDNSATSTTTAPLVLWHQDEAYLYVTPASVHEISAGGLTAIAVGSIQAVRYLAGYIRVGSDGRIDTSHVASTP